MTPIGVPKLVAVVRVASSRECREVIEGLVRASFPAIEITMTVPNAISLVREFSCSNSLIGAGTVRDPDTCAASIDAGARFIMSPHLDTEVLARAQREAVPYIGGALTPSEVVAASRAGCDAVKVFPIGPVGGARYLRALHEPLPEIDLVASGGVRDKDVASYFSAGASAVCLGSSLTAPDERQPDRSEVVWERARSLLEALGAPATS